MIEGHSPEAGARKHVDVVVLGTTLPELAAALDIARLGLSVRVLVPHDDGESSAQLRSQQVLPEETLLGDRVLDELLISHLPVGLQFDPEGVLTDLIHEVAEPLIEGYSPEFTAETKPPARWWVEVNGNWFEQPSDSIYGIPTSPLSAEVSQPLGTVAALRAYTDRLKPVLTIGKTQYLAQLVTSRMGKRVLQSFVEPWVRHRYGVSADAVEVSVFAPGLNEAITRAGSLSGAALAYQDRYVTREARVAPSTGWPEFGRMLMQKLRLFGAEIVQLPDTVQVSRLADDKGWQVELPNSGFTAAAIVSANPPIKFAEDSQVSTKRLTELSSTRSYAAFDIEPPVWWPEPHATQALRMFETSDEEQWSCAVELVSETRWRAELRGPAGSHTANMNVEKQAELLSRAEIQGEPEAELLFIIDRAEAATEHERSALHEQLAAIGEEYPDLIFCPVIAPDTGLAEAVHTARQLAVEVRRRVAGIA